MRSNRFRNSFPPTKIIQEMMDMTPVRVRGKYKRNQAYAKQKKGTSHQDEVRDRSHKCARAPSSMFMTAATMQQRTPKLSRLESLPTELLVTIFFQCLNISLPQASLHLGNTLGSQSLKIELFLKAFTSEDDDLLHRDEVWRILRVREQASVRAQIGYLQSRILRLRWLDWRLVKICMEAFAVRVLMRTFRDQRWTWMDGNPVQRGVIQDFVHGVFAPDTLEAEEILMQQRSLVEEQTPPTMPLTTASLKLWRWDSPTTGNQLTLGLGPRQGYMILTSSRLRGEDPTDIDTGDTYCWRLFFPMETCEIPTKLLRRPWTDSKLNLLEALVYGTSFIDWECSLSGEIAIQGLEDAVRDDNFRAVDLLTKEHMMAQFASPNHPHFVEPSFADVTLGSTTGPHPLPLVRVNLLNGVNVRHTCEIEPAEKHLRIAVVEKGCDRRIVDRIFWAQRSSTTDWISPEIISWAVEKKEQNDERGQWLLDAIDEQARWNYRQRMNRGRDGRLLGQRAIDRARNRANVMVAVGTSLQLSER